MSGDNETRGDFSTDGFAGARAAAIADLNSSLEGPDTGSETPVEASQDEAHLSGDAEATEGQPADEMLAEGAEEDEGETEDEEGEPEESEDAEESDENRRERLPRWAKRKLEQREGERDAFKADAERHQTHAREALEIAQGFQADYQEVTSQLQVAESKLVQQDAYIARLHQQLEQLGHPVAPAEIESLRLASQRADVERERDAYRAQLEAFQRQQQETAQMQQQAQIRAQAEQIKAEINAAAKRFRVNPDDALALWVSKGQLGQRVTPEEAVRLLASPRVRAQLERNRAEPKQVKAKGTGPGVQYAPGAEGAKQMLRAELGFS